LSDSAARYPIASVSRETPAKIYYNFNQIAEGLVGAAMIFTLRLRKLEAQRMRSSSAPASRHSSKSIANFVIGIAAARPTLRT
jgi:hypothetical protein